MKHNQEKEIQKSVTGCRQKYLHFEIYANHFRHFINYAILTKIKPLRLIQIINVEASFDYLNGLVKCGLKCWCRVVTFCAETRSAWCRRTARRWSCGRRRSRPTASWTTTDNILPSHRRLPACTGIRISQVTSLLAIRMAHSPSTPQVFDTHTHTRAKEWYECMRFSAHLAVLDGETKNLLILPARLWERA